MEIVFRPLPGWPLKPRTSRSKADFAPDFNKILHLLERELRHMQAKGVIIQTGHKESEISITLSRPLANTAPAFPGVIVLADTKWGSLSWPCDKFHRWQDNLRNIALYMERQRLMSEQGVGEGGEAYRGHKMLPGPVTAPADAPTLTIEAAARFVASVTELHRPEQIIQDKRAWTNAYRAAAAELHPDSRGHSRERWNKLQDAKQLLDNLHQGRK